MARLEYVVRGAKRLASAPTRTRLPITLTLLAQLRCSWLTSRSGRDASMLWAAATMCFFGFLRAGEVVVPSDSAFDPSIHLTVKDISVDSHSSPRTSQSTSRRQRRTHLGGGHDLPRSNSQPDMPSGGHIEVYGGERPRRSAIIYV